MTGIGVIYHSISCICPLCLQVDCVIQGAMYIEFGNPGYLSHDCEAGVTIMVSPDGRGNWKDKRVKDTS
jgi:hypothetical protein